MAENQNVENVELTEQDLTEQHRIRLEKLAELKANGKNPFEITKYDVNAKSEDIKADFENLEGKTVSIAGRMMNRRIMGKASFINIRDDIGNIQAYVRRDDIGEELYADFKKWDLGDIIGSKVLFSRQRQAKFLSTLKRLFFLLNHFIRYLTNTQVSRIWKCVIVRDMLTFSLTPM